MIGKDTMAELPQALGIVLAQYLDQHGIHVEVGPDGTATAEPAAERFSGARQSVRSPAVEATSDLVIVEV